MINTENIYRTTLVYQDYTGSDRETVLIDMLADLMHYADEYGDDFADALRIATNHHTEEVNERQHNLTSQTQEAQNVRIRRTTHNEQTTDFRRTNDH